MHSQFYGEDTYNAETEVRFPNLTVGQTLSLLLRVAFLGTESRASLETTFRTHARRCRGSIWPFTH
jgi:hypothetical protein